MPYPPPGPIFGVRLIARGHRLGLHPAIFRIW
jgi:hypothetical protein